MNRKLCTIGIFLLILMDTSCQKDNQPEPDRPNSGDLPVLVDDVPYEKLNEGIIVFKRLGPREDSYRGFYVIDVDRKMSWPIDVGSASSPALSPNGQQIAFSRLTSTGLTPANWDIAIMDIYGRNLHNVVDRERFDQFPSWTPDGLKILYFTISGTPPNRRDLRMQSPVADSPGRVLIKDFVGPRSPVSVSIQGKIAFLGTDNDLFVMDINGGDLQLLVSKAVNGHMQSPVFSSDGKTIGFLAVWSDLSGYQSIDIIKSMLMGPTYNPFVRFKLTGSKIGGYILHTYHYAGLLMTLNFSLRYRKEILPLIFI